MQLKTFPITLEQAYMISPSVKHFVFNTPETENFEYIPGQFITIHFDHQGKNLKRSYSIANVPARDNRIEFAAGYIEDGPGTKLLFDLKEGESVQINGPFGRLILKESPPKRYILVATSTGVTPYKAMIHALKEQMNAHPDLSVVILQGVQRKEDVLYQDDFLNFATEFPQVKFFSQLSREANPQLDPHERIGYVQSAFPLLNLNPTQDLVYLCGNPGMIDDAFSYLKEQGFAMQNIIREKYISR